MNLLFLGTGAAEAYDLAEAEMDSTRRRCAAVLVNGQVLVDVSRQSFDFMVKLGKDPSKVTDILLSHSHADHFCKEAFFQFVAAAKSPLRFWCHSGALERLKFSEEELSRFQLCLLEGCDVFDVSGMRVTALPANHVVGNLTSKEIPLHYLLEAGETRVYYGCDGGWYTAVEWEYLLRNKIRLDGVIMDCTVGEDVGNFRIGTHNNLAMLKILISALRQNGMIDERSLVIATHISKACHTQDRPLEEVFGEIGLQLAQDGGEIQV